MTARKPWGTYSRFRKATARKPSKAKRGRCFPECPDYESTKRKPKGKTIRAWAVVQASGMVDIVWRDKDRAEREVAAQNAIDRRVPPSHRLGPFTVVPLSGTFTPGRKG